MTSRLALLAAACLLVLTGCGDDRAGDDGGTGAGQPSTSASSDAGTAAPSAGASSSAAGGGTSYVALGDSYTAAPLVPTTTPAGNPCLRSTGNYPSLVAKALPDLSLTDVSCSGADSAAMIGVQEIGSELNPAQFDALTADTKLVTIGLGGNDFGLYSSMLRDCASSSDLAAQGSPCTDAATGGGAEDLTTVVPQIEPRIAAVIQGVKARSPQAKIIVVGYPQLVPTEGTCAAFPVAQGDYQYVRSLNKGLNDQIGAAAKASGVQFIDVYAASEGHDICSDDPWVNGKDTDPAAALAFHPFAEEQQAVADLIVKAIKG